ncbi:FxSxx-COOH cyclophane-containing RiPP peptide [Streptomyces asoensis]|uniref:FxSxx-COOH cyclophane-containing RiPP peptide n=1 Tax=Streptomyces sp. MBT97 TaxID=2800411 RepID=UPI00190E4306|nr:FxSxx-COOH cyclophane-containing RiPP peptide [Streptomyces sp. MBT97]MBK3635059.1 FXSXX-COOH protein [Streptomyces sp. MBT97]
MDGLEPADHDEPTGAVSSGPTEPPDPEEGPSDRSGLAGRGPGDLSDLPDLTRLSLAELGSVQHPLLQEVLADLRERAKRPSEMLWGWNSSF